MTDQTTNWKILSKRRYYQRNLVKILLIATGFAIINGFAITYAQDGNSEKEQFNARVEQRFSEASEGIFRAEKTGNVVRLISTEHRVWQRHYAQLFAKYWALYVLEMDSTAKLQNPAHELATFFKLLLCEPDGTIVSPAIVFREDYADWRAIMAAEEATHDELAQERHSILKSLSRQH